MSAHQPAAVSERTGTIHGDMERHINEQAFRRSPRDACTRSEQKKSRALRAADRRALNRDERARAAAAVVSQLVFAESRAGVRLRLRDGIRARHNVRETPQAPMEARARPAARGVVGGGDGGAATTPTCAYTRYGVRAVSSDYGLRYMYTPANSRCGTSTDPVRKSHIARSIRSSCSAQWHGYMIQDEPSRRTRRGAALGKTATTRTRGRPAARGRESPRGVLARLTSGSPAAAPVTRRRRLWLVRLEKSRVAHKKCAFQVSRP